MPNVINGTTAAEKLTGTVGDDLFDGGLGNDTVYGGSGNDVAVGGEGNDVLVGEAGNDTLYGGNGNDSFYGGGGNDTIYGEAGDDGINADGGDDVIYGGPGNNSVGGGTGNDVLVHVVGEGTEMFWGQAGTDTMELHLTSGQLNAATRADLASLKAFMSGELATAGSAAALAGQATAGSLTLSALGVTVSTIEAVKVVVDGAVVSLDSLLNQAPTAAAVVEASLAEDGVLAGNVGATDADGDTLAYSVGTGPANGTLELDANTGAYVYKPAANWSGSDSFEVQVTDAAGAVVTQEVRVSVDAVADAPTLDAVALPSSTAARLTGPGVTVDPAVISAAGVNLVGTKAADNLVGGLGADTITGSGGNDTLVGNGGKLATVALGIDASLVDTDGSELLSVTIGNLPAGALLSAGVANPDGSWTLAATDLSGLTLTATFTGDVDLTVTATSVEANGASASTTQQVHIGVTVGGDTLNGGEGHDSLTGSAGNDTLTGGKGDDVVSGGAGNDLLDGNSGNDVLSDGAGNDSVKGSSGNDVLLAGLGDDVYSGGSGFDTLDFSGAAGSMTIDVSKSTATGMGTDTFSSIEKIIGSAFADDFKGSSRADKFDGGAGDDHIRGMAGADTLTGGEGADTFQWLAKDLVSGSKHLGVDRITDFGAGDRLDLHDMLKKFAPSDAVNHVRVVDGAHGSTVSVDIAGKFVSVAVLEGVHDTSAADLLASGAILA